jgi:TRAP-type transport system small permease protein
MALTPVDRLLDGVCKLFSALMALALALMVLLVFGNVVLRYGFNSGFTLSEELSRWLFVWMTFLGAAVALHERAHLGTDTLVARLPVRGKKLCLALSYLLMLWMCWMVFKGAWAQTVINSKSVSAVMEASMGILYATGVIFSVVGGVVLLNLLWRLASGRTPDSELAGFVESEESPHGQAAAR